MILLLLLVYSVQATCPNGLNQQTGPDGDSGCWGKLATVHSSCPSTSNGNLDIWISSANNVNEIYSIFEGQVNANTAKIDGNILSQTLNVLGAATVNTMTVADNVEVKGNVVMTGASSSLTAVDVTLTGHLEVDDVLSTRDRLFNGKAAEAGRADVAATAESCSGHAASASRLTGYQTGRRDGFHGGGKHVSPSAIPRGTVQHAFTNWGTTGDGYADAFLLNTWTDSTGGSVNVLKVRKNAIGLRVMQGGWASRFSPKSGPFTTWSTAQMTASSDQRLKKNVQVISSPLDKINQLRGVNFEWKPEYFMYENKQGEKEYSEKYDEGLQMGFIAQELQSVIPEVVSTGQSGYDGLDDVLAVDYEKITALLLQGIKELHAKHDALVSLVQTQQTTISDLTTSLDNL
jgi:hypothetical protein